MDIAIAFAEAHSAMYETVFRQMAASIPSNVKLCFLTDHLLALSNILAAPG
jgi:hypothetical protein